VDVDLGVMNNASLATLRSSPEKATTEDVVSLIKRIDFSEEFAGTRKYWELMSIMHDLAGEKGFGPDHIEAVLSQRCCQNCRWHHRNDELEGTWKYECTCGRGPTHGRETHFDFRCAYWSLREDLQP